MSMYGEGDYNYIYDQIKWFLEDYPVSELLQIISDVVEREIENE